MVKLTVDVMARGTSGYTKKKRDESLPHYLKRLTHLYLEGRHIDEISEDLSMCRHLTVLYLYDNHLAEMPNLTYNNNLTHLYLQNNHISKMEHLGTLRKLTKLYLGYNQISVVEGLEMAWELQELHVELQAVPRGEKVLFDPRSLTTLAGSLQVLNVSGNHLDSLSELSQLSSLTQLVAADNCLHDRKQLMQCLARWRHLWSLELAGNPVCHRAKYRDQVLIASPALKMLDGKEVMETTKQFLRNWQANKEALSRRRQSSTSVGTLQQGETPSRLPALTALAAAPTASLPAFIMSGIRRKQIEGALLRSESFPQARGIGITGTPLAELVPTKLPTIFMKTLMSNSSAASVMPIESTFIDLRRGL